MTRFPPTSCRSRVLVFALLSVWVGSASCDRVAALRRPAPESFDPNDPVAAAAWVGVQSLRLDEARSTGNKARVEAVRREILDHIDSKKGSPVRLVGYPAEIGTDCLRIQWEFVDEGYSIQRTEAESGSSVRDFAGLLYVACIQADSLPEDVYLALTLESRLEIAGTFAGFGGDAIFNDRSRQWPPRGRLDLGGVKVLSVDGRPVPESILPDPVPIAPDPGVRFIRAIDLQNDASVSPAVCAIDGLTTMESVEQLLTEGYQEFVKGGAPAPKAKRINGIFASEGTGIVRLNISRGNSSIDIWNELEVPAEDEGEHPSLNIVDIHGNRYTPIGYLWVKPYAVEIKLDPKRGIPTIGDFPNLPSSGTHELYALFNPTAGAKIVRIRLGDKVVANADHLVASGG